MEKILDNNIEEFKINDIFLEKKFQKPDFSKLNKEQYEAVMHNNGPLLVIAGAGSGKTSVITNRLARLVYDGTPAEAILLLTFTNKAAREMLERAKKILNSESEIKVIACTYHAFCAIQIRKYASLLNIQPDFTILDSVDTVDTMNLMKETYGYGNDKNFPKGKEIVNILSTCKNKEYEITNYIENTNPPLLEYTNGIQHLNDKYSDYKLKNNMLDFDDLLLLFLKLLKENPHIAKEISDTYDYIMVDEYQDSNFPQMKILMELRNKGNDNLMVVGDDFQSIYSFRGAEISNILNFPKQWPNCKTIVLNQNYRSNQMILDFSNEVTKCAKEKFTKSLIGNHTNGSRPIVLNVDTQDTEARCVLSKIHEFHEQGMPYKNMAAIIRSSNDSLFLEKLLTTYKIPFQKFGGIKFLERSHIKDILAFLKVSINHKDEISWFRVFQLYPDIGKKNAKELAEFIKQNSLEDLLNSYKYMAKSYAPYLNEIYNELSKLSSMSLKAQIEFLIEYRYKLMENVIKKSRRNDTSKTDALKDNDQNYKDSKLLIDMAEGYLDALSFLTDITLETPNTQEDGDYFNVTTVHSAKGLEYDVVFVIHCTDNKFPSVREPKYPTPVALKELAKSLEEERRVFYVAITRAKKYLYLTIPKRITTYGSTNITEPSRYLTETLEVQKTYGNMNVK